MSSSCSQSFPSGCSLFCALFNIVFLILHGAGLIVSRSFILHLCNRSKFSDRLRVVEDLKNPPHSWFLSRPADPTHRFQLSIAPQKGSHVADTLYKISTPGHAQYGMHLSQAEARQLLSADDDSHKDIMKWLAQANRILNATFQWYKHADVEKEVLRTLYYSVPEVLHDKVAMISPTTRFCSTMGRNSAQHEDLKTQVSSSYSNAFPVSKRASVDPSCNRTVTPNCIKALYNVPANMTLSKARGVGVYASQDQVAKFEDYRLFVKNIEPAATGSNFTFLSINGTLDQNNTTTNAEETNFDIQYSATLSFPIPNLIFSIGGQGPLQPEQGNHPGDGSEPWLQWLDAILALPDSQLSHTITTSFGEDEQSLPDGYIQQVCNQFGALGARGVSMIAASGDGPGSTCTTNDGNGTRFSPIFPGSCPFVTAVGGTKGVNPEIAVSFSAGGFSDKFARPAYQDQAVPAYLKIVGKQFDGLFNSSGRGFPDVASQAFNLTFVDQGFIKGFAGTSAGSPTWAGLIGMINGALIAQNKAPLGFLNPWLYSTGLGGMTDITTGGSVGCTGNNPFTGQPFPALFAPKLVPNAGWNASVGWDAVTGLGTPDIGKLLVLAMKGNGTAAKSTI